VGVAQVRLRTAGTFSEQVVDANRAVEHAVGRRPYGCPAHPVPFDMRRMRLMARELACGSSSHTVQIEIAVYIVSRRAVLRTAGTFL
jgi:hypothetical protein